MQTVLDLLVLSDRYDYSSLKQSLERILCSYAELSNVLQLISYADMYNAVALYKHCADYIDKKADVILKSQGMMVLPKEHLKSLLRRDSFMVSETAIFEAVMKWKDYNDFEVQEITDVLECIRLSEIPTRELESVVRPSGMYSKSVLEEAVKLSLSPSNYLRKPRGKLGTYIH